MNPKKIGILVSLVVLLIFIFQNTQVVTLKLLFWKISMSMIIFLLLILFLGFVFGKMMPISSLKISKEQYKKMGKNNK
ncbi:MAG: lipopolysaccharide assembly protein LapA domain-containing protein [Candidatus Thorarchaeota archaeon]